MIKLVVTTNPEKLPCVTINSDGTVRIFDGENVVNLPFNDYLISIRSGKSPFSRVFLPEIPKLILPSEDKDED